MQNFLDYFGNFDNLVKTWTRSPPNSHRNGSTNTRKSMASVLKHIIFISGNLKIRTFSEKKRKVHPLFCFRNIFLKYVLGNMIWEIFSINKLWVYILKIILRRWGTEDDNMSINKIHKNLDMNFISIKTWNRFLIIFIFSGKGIPKVFYSQGRESSNIN